MRAAHHSVALLALLAAPTFPQQPRTTSTSTTKQQVALVGDILRGPNGLGGGCLDSRIANERAATGSSRQWPASFLREVLADSAFALDTTVALTFRPTRACAPSSRSFRYAIGLPEITADSARIVFVRSWISQPGEVDSALVTIRLHRENGRWGVAETLADSLMAPRTVQGIGCYRFSHPLFREPSEAHLRIDTVLVRAESTLVHYQMGGSGHRGLSPDQTHVGFAKSETSPYAVPAWYVTHDTLHLIWSVMDHALYADLHVIGDSLDGQMHTETDVVGVPEPTVQVVGRRVACAGQ